MKLSKKKRDALYAAVYEPIMQQRINIKMSEVDKIAVDDIDKILFQLEITIANEVDNALGLKDRYSEA